MKIYDKNGREMGIIYDEFIKPEEPFVPEPEEPEEPAQRVSITRRKIEEIFNDATRERINEFYNTFIQYARDFNINNETQENFFLAQIVAETGYDLVPKRENLNYSCDALKRIFSRYKNNPNWARRDGRCDGHPANQVNIGNIAYADRIGNGGIESGDGYRFRGGGYFQLTGRGNYERNAKVLSEVLGKEITPEEVESEIETVHMALLTAMAFWYDNKCNYCADIDCVTEKINKYTDSYEKRKEIYQWIASL